MEEKIKLLIRFEPFQLSSAWHFAYNGILLFKIHTLQEDANGWKRQCCARASNSADKWTSDYSDNTKILWSQANFPSPCLQPTLFLPGQSTPKPYLLKYVYGGKQAGLSLIVGDIGSGKTSLSRLVFNEYADKPEHIVKYVTNPHLNTKNQFLRLICDEFGDTYHQRLLYAAEEFPSIPGRVPMRRSWALSLLSMRRRFWKVRSSS